MEELVVILSRWMHIGTAVVIVGGSVFLRFVVLPAASKLPEDQHLALRSAIISRWKMFIHVGILLFLVSGFYNYLVVAKDMHIGQKLYHPLIGTKILLALVVFALSSILVGRSSLANKMRLRTDFWLGIVIVLATVIIGISGYVKVALPAHPSPVVATPAVTVEIAP